MIWVELCTTYSSSSPVVTTTSIILCFNKHWLTQVHLKMAVKTERERVLHMLCLLHNYVPGRSLRSSQSSLLSVPMHKLNFDTCSFHVALPTVWNSLLADIRACIFYGSFIHQLKSFILIMLFSKWMLLGPYWLPAPLIQCFMHWLFARCKLFLWLWLLHQPHRRR